MCQSMFQKLIWTLSGLIELNLCELLCSLVVSLCSHDGTTIHCSKAAGFWMVEHQLVKTIKTTHDHYLTISSNLLYAKSCSFLA